MTEASVRYREQERAYWQDTSRYYLQTVAEYTRAAASWEHMAQKIRIETLGMARRWLLTTLAYRSVCLETEALAAKENPKP